MILYRQNYAALTFVPKPRKRKPILSIRPRRVRGRRKPDAPTGTTRPAFDLLGRIDEIRDRHGLSDSAIDRQAVNDPNLVYALRDGTGGSGSGRERGSWLASTRSRRALIWRVEPQSPCPIARATGGRGCGVTIDGTRNRFRPLPPC
ncbi:hypothetical protein ACFSUK_20870 [Sphingobium scionense]